MNKGYTFVEVIVVVVVIGIMACVGFMGFSSLYKLDGKSTLESLSVIMDKARYTAMSTTNTVTLEIRDDDSRYIATIKEKDKDKDGVKIISEHKIGKSRYTLKFVNNEVKKEINENTTLEIIFSKGSTGKVDSIKVDGTEVLKEENKFTVSNTEEVLKLATETGRTILE